MFVSHQDLEQADEAEVGKVILTIDGSRKLDAAFLSQNRSITFISGFLQPQQQ